MKTTDNQNELFDVVNKDDRVVRQATRAEVHQNKNLIHRSIGVAIFNKKGEIFLQQRSAGKDTDPTMWTISCSGHVLSGEDYEKTVLRELKEELGLNLTKSVSIEPVCKYLCRAPNETEMVMLYKAIYNGQFKLNPKEILQGKFFTQKELLEAIEPTLSADSPGKMETRRKRGEHPVPSRRNVGIGTGIDFSFMGKVALEKLGWS